MRQCVLDLLAGLDIPKADCHVATGKGQAAAGKKCHRLDSTVSAKALQFFAARRISEAHGPKIARKTPAAVGRKGQATDGVRSIETYKLLAAFQVPYSYRAVVPAGKHAPAIR